MLGRTTLCEPNALRSQVRLSLPRQGAIVAPGTPKVNPLASLGVAPAGLDIRRTPSPDLHLSGGEGVVSYPARLRRRRRRARGPDPVGVPSATGRPSGR